MESVLFPSFNKKDDSDLINQDVFLPKFQSIEYKIDQILNKIKNIDSCSDEEIKQIILRQYHMILNYDLFLANEREFALELFTNKRFLAILASVVGSLELADNEIVCLNKIVYDYYTLDEKDLVISHYLLEISYYVNNKTVIRLSAILGMNGARILAMISKSSFKIEKNVKRVNHFIMKVNIGLSIQDIVNIYIMLETEPANLTDEKIKRFRAISAVVLILLNNMTSQDIHTVISNYIYTIQYMNVERETRFSLIEACKVNKLDRIYKIIKDVIYELDLSSDFYI